MLGVGKLAGRSLRPFLEWEGFRHEGSYCSMHGGRSSLGYGRRDERRSLQRRGQKGRREHFAEVKPRQVWGAGPKPLGPVAIAASRL